MGIFKRIRELENQNASMALEIIELKKRLEDNEVWKKVHEDCQEIDARNIRSSFNRLGAELKEVSERVPLFEEAVAKGVDDVWNKAVQSIVDYNPFKTQGGDG